MVVGFSCKPPSAPPKPPVIGFASALQNPFGISPNAVAWSAPTFVDLDNDGDQDLFVGENGGDIQYFQNTGSASSPAFASPSVLKSAVGFAVPVFVDIDADGDFDLFVGEYDSSGKARLKYFPNTGNPTVPNFPASTTSPFGLTTTNQLANPAFVDIDGDGDMDLFVGEYGGIIQYFQNTGTATLPAFAAPVPSPFGLSYTYYLAFPAFADIDGDGDYDLLVGEYYGTFQYFQNTGSASLPAFAAPVASPYNLTSLYGWAIPTFVDLDNDGDMDLFSGEYSENIYYFENTTY
jgi:hypothetical protein